MNPGVPGDIINVDYNKTVNNALIIADDNNIEKVIILNNVMTNSLSVNCKDINNSEDLQNKIQSISKKKRIIISDRGAIEDSKEVSIITVDNEEEFLGIIFEDNDASCIFSMSILDFDL